MSPKPPEPYEGSDHPGTGYVPISAGAAIFAGENVDALNPHERAQRGLIRTFQSLELFEDLSVRDNLLVAAHRAQGDQRMDNPNARTVLKFALVLGAAVLLNSARGAVAA